MSNAQQWLAVDGDWYPPARNPNDETPPQVAPTSNANTSSIQVEVPHRESRADDKRSDSHPIQVEVTNVPVPLRTNACAVISLICAVAVPVPLAAIVFGLVGGRQVTKSMRDGAPERGSGLAMAGFFLGTLELIGLLVALAYLFTHRA
jgi:hypothetical protein